MLATLCHRLGGLPAAEAPAATPVPHVDVEQRPLSTYDEFAACHIR